MSDITEKEINDTESTQPCEVSERESIENELKDKIRIWQKNEQALMDMSGLLYILRTNISSGISGAALFFRVLNNLQDPEITIGYKGKSLYSELQRLNKEIDALATEYSEILSDANKYFKSIRSMNIDGYFYDYRSRLLDENENQIRWYENSYSLIESLIKADQIKWIRELLSSNISSNCRVVMLDEIIRSNAISLNALVADRNYPDSIYPAVWALADEEEEKKKLIETVNELFKMWVQSTVKGDVEYEIVKALTMENLKFLQTNGWLDFVSDLTYNSRLGTVATPAQIYCKNKDGIYHFGTFYDTESYQKLSPEIKKRTDKFLIHHIVKYECAEVDRLIGLKNFKVTDENIQEIILALSEYQVCEWQIKKICDAIEKKATTPKEYRKFQQYIQKIRNALDPEELARQRQELVLRLRNMKESLEEQVPGKMKIKDIRFLK